MSALSFLKEEISKLDLGHYVDITEYMMYLGYKEHYNDCALRAKAYAIARVFMSHEKYVYDNDLVAGSIFGRYSSRASHNEAELKHAGIIADSYGRNGFWTNADHFAADFETPLNLGIGGMIDKIKKSALIHRDGQDSDKKDVFLDSALITMTAFSHMILGYGEAALEKGMTLKGEQKKNLLEIARICNKISVQRPETFHEALQLLWLIHISFLYEKKFAMALGRLDQYLYPFYKRDVDAGILTKERATELLECTLYKIIERKLFNKEAINLGADDVVNIAIGGVDSNGEDAVNELSYLILEAVKSCSIAGPNLSARIHGNIPDEFLDKCIEVIGTGIGYPALMNDEINIPALMRYKYNIIDCRNYCMVGCIENFVPGKQPPWTDQRFNSPKYLELALNNGKCMQTGAQLGPETGDASEFMAMDDCINAFVRQMEFGAAEHMAIFNNENNRYNAQMYSQPYLSCYCRDCIERGLDICDGGAVYPSAHGIVCMGVATIADSLAAIEKVVFTDKIISLSELRGILMDNFEGHDDIRRKLLSVPKYGNNNDFVDRYAQWFVDIHSKIFSNYRTRDGGPVYIAIASNITNVSCGREVAATADGRRNTEPLSEAASPMHGFDKNGATSVVNSVSKLDFTKAACGTVLNQKFSPGIFESAEKRAKLKALIKTYFNRGGQEIQINAVSGKILRQATKKPEEYSNLVVRVSGFSAYYTRLDPDIQKDILERTEHE